MERPDIDIDLGRRYRVRRRLGQGGFGDVYLADDAEGGGQVAIKHLRQVAPERLQQFKQEFRLLADQSHRNLVQYRELINHRDGWYLIMEHVRGVTFRDYIVGLSEAMLATGGGKGETATQVMDETAIEAVASGVTPVRPYVDPPQLERLRGALPGLVAGLRHLHRAGIIHRDIKPSNVLVTPDGRVVIVDFGLAWREVEHESISPGAAGTLYYMAPEQVRGAGVGPAADFYAVGSMLYELLTGEIPFAGATEGLIERKRCGARVDDGRIPAAVPEDLRALCLDLLEPQPSRRPDVAAIMRRLDAGAENESSGFAPVTLIGRDEQLQRLLGTAAAAERGQPRVTVVRGSSGVGKSALIGAFLAEWRKRRKGVIFAGRCFAGEYLPYKALDGVIDALAAFLADLDPKEQAALLPRHVRALAELFPVLDRVDAIRAAPRIAERGDAQQARRRAFIALRELMAAIGDRWPLVVVIDDMQWGDADSAQAIGELLSPPDAPLLHLVLSFRLEDGGDRGQARIRRHLRVIEDAGIDELEVGRFDPAGSAAYAMALSSRQLDDATCERIHAESGGHPLLIQEMVRAHAFGRDSVGALSLNELLGGRIAELGPRQRALLDLVAVAGRPLRLSWLRAAAAMAPGDEEPLVDLRATGLVIHSSRGGIGHLVGYHDKVAEIGGGLLPEERRRELHARLAQAIETCGDGDAEAEALSVHYRAAGDLAAARGHALRAAHRAEQALAFDRAARLYRQVLADDDQDPDGALHLAMADALANAGRGADSGRAYRAAAERCGSELRLHALHRACGQFLRSGSMDDGLAVAREVLAAVGLRWWNSSNSALLSLLWQRLILKLRGLGFDAVPEAEQDMARLAQVDSLWNLGHGLGGVDTVRGAEFQSRHLLGVLRSGEPYRVAKALAWEAVLAAAEGGPAGSQRARDLTVESAALAEAIEHPHALAWSHAAAAFVAWTDNRWEDSFQRSNAAMALYAERCRDVTWEEGSLLAWCRLPALATCGRLQQLKGEVAACERRFANLGDLYTLVTLKTNVEPWLHLAADDPDRAAGESAGAIAQWTKQAWHLQHFCDWLTQARVLLYRGNGVAAWELLQRHWSQHRKALQHRLQLQRVQLCALRGHAALAAWHEDPGRRTRYQATLRRDRKQLDGEDKRLAEVLSLGLQAGSALIEENPGQAASIYGRLAQLATEAKMPLVAATARLHRARCEGGDDGAARQVLADEGVVDGDRFASVLVPFPSTRGSVRSSIFREV